MDFLNPEETVSHFHLQEGMRVADFGAGAGWSAFALARKVGSGGRVYAVEIQKDLLAKVKNAAREMRLENVEVIWGNLDEPGGSKIATGSLDAALIQNVLFQSEHKPVLLAEAKRVLKRGGEALVIEWNDKGVAQDAARELLRAAGFAVQNEFPAGSHHYGILAVSN